MIQTIRGTKDILPQQINQWQFIADVFNKISSNYGYSEIRTPIFEKTEVYVRGVGDSTDIVNKEMYTFTDKGGESITLRPEMTAGLVRAVIQNSLLSVSPMQKLWYFGPFFRYERPQKGRMRQFHQYGAECIGSNFPESDVEVIMLADSLFKAAGIKNHKLLINTLGNDSTRTVYRNELIAYLKTKTESLSEDSKNRLEHNPLRVLDSKDPKDKEAVENAPYILDFLDTPSLEHFETCKKLLDASNVDYIVQPRLVRGLDYYCHTVFEFQSDALGAQDSLGGGGRYDGLFQQLGAKQTPAVGFALGVERMLLTLEAQQNLPQDEPVADIFIVAPNIELQPKVQNIATELRNKNLKTVTDLMRRSMKAQMREANRLNVKYTLIFGDSEAEKNCIQIKNMNTTEQIEISLDDLNNFQF